MNSMIELPVYDDENLAACSCEQLIENMVRDEDRVPRNVIDECVRRGEQMLGALAPYAKPDDELEHEVDGYWWLRLHAIMMLGLMPGETAGILLVEYIRNMCRDEDMDLQEWFSGYFPALTRNKPAPVIALFRDMANNMKIDWYVRTNITDAVIADAQRQGESALEQALDWVAEFAASSEEDWEFRLSVGNTLLDFPRDRYRELLDKLAAEQSGFGVHFDKNDIDKAYTKNIDTPDWERFSDPWRFYEPREIANRQQRWQEEALYREEMSKELEELNELDELIDHGPYYQHHEPYQRETPRIGRNDPCYCGSGKKYKKCCLNKEREMLH